MAFWITSINSEHNLDVSEEKNKQYFIKRSENILQVVPVEKKPIPKGFLWYYQKVLDPID